MDAVQLYMTRYGPMRADGEGLFQGLSDEQIRQCPHPAVNSIAWLVWHMARVEDMAVSRLVARRPPLISDGDWLARLGVTRCDVGTAMTDEEVADLSARLDLDGLRAYWRAVGDRTVSVVQALRPDELDEVNEAEYVRQVCAEDGLFVEEAGWVVDYLEGKSKGLMLSQLALTHLFSHIGEARVTRALLGLRGR
jgi:hypothetical protein